MVQIAGAKVSASGESEEDFSSLYIMAKETFTPRHGSHPLGGHTLDRPSVEMKPMTKADIISAACQGQSLLVADTRQK